MLVIDLSIVAIANYHVLRKYTQEEHLTAELWATKTLEAISALKITTNAITKRWHTVLVMDEGPSWRKLVSGTYKYGRVRNDHMMEIRPEMEAIVKGAEKCFSVASLEADDLAYILTKQFSNVTLVSNDGDFKALVRGHGHSWLTYSDRKEYRLPNDHTIAVDMAVKANLSKAFLGCPTDAVAPIYKESAFDKFAMCLKDVELSVKEEFLRTGQAEELLNFMCAYNNLRLVDITGATVSAFNRLLDNFMLTGYCTELYELFCPEAYAKAMAWIDSNRSELSSLNKFSLF